MPIIGYFSFADNFECTNSFVGFDGHCYRYIPNSLTWLQAKHSCHNYGGYLVEIGTVAENEFVEGQYISENSKPCPNCDTGEGFVDMSFAASKHGDLGKPHYKLMEMYGGVLLKFTLHSRKKI